MKFPASTFPLVSTCENEKYMTRDTIIFGVAGAKLNFSFYQDSERTVQEQRIEIGITSGVFASLSLAIYFDFSAVQISLAERLCDEIRPRGVAFQWIDKNNDNFHSLQFHVYVALSSSALASGSAPAATDVERKLLMPNKIIEC